MAITVRSGSQAESLSVPGLGITGAGDMDHTGVGQAIGDAVDGVARAGATDEAMLEDTPGAVDFMAAKASMVKADSTVVEAFMVEADSMAEVVSTEVVATVADTANRVEATVK
jgi:hypothetical protein